MRLLKLFLILQVAVINISCSSIFTKNKINQVSNKDFNIGNPILMKSIPEKYQIEDKIYYCFDEENISNLLINFKTLLDCCQTKNYQEK